jgi:hypothetical protein
VRVRPLSAEPPLSPRRPGEQVVRDDDAGGKSLGAYRAEAKKCVLVCANCHGEIEAGLISSPPPGATFTRRG